MPATKLKEFLDHRGIRYVSIRHSPAFTAQEVAASAHIAGRDFAKTVIVRIDGELAMVIVPANRKILLADLRDMLETDDVQLASEHEFKHVFPDFEVGAMPPFGNLYGLPVYLERSLADQDELAFNACSHAEVLKMSVADYVDLVQPRVIDFVTV